MTGLHDRTHVVIGGLKRHGLSLFAAIVWTLLTFFAWSLHLIEDRDSVLSRTIAHAKARVDQNLGSLVQNSRAGGSYVSVSETRQPVSALAHVPERDVRTVSGRVLTLINPACMGDAPDHPGGADSEETARVVSRFTSRAAFQPDPWERTALEAFIAGAGERTETVDMGGRQFIRAMKPLFGESSCLKCHEQEGWTSGEIVGGVSVRIPLPGARSAPRSQRETAGVAALWLAGLVGLAYSSRIMERDRRKLVAEEQKFRNMADLTYDWEDWVAEDGQVIYVSPSCERITGFRPEEFRADRSLKGRLVHPDDSAVWRRHVEATREGQDCSVSQIQFRIISRDGSIRWIHHVCVGVRDSEGRCAGRRSSNRDVTEREESIAQLRLLALVVDQIKDRVTITDPDGTITFVNRAQSVGLSRPKDELLGQRPNSYGDDPASGATQDEILKATTEHGQWSGEVVNRGSDGSRTLISLWTKQIRDAHGKVIAYCGVGQDITEQRRTEEELRQREALYRAVIETSSDGFWVADMEGRILDVNESYTRMSGYSRDELITMRVPDLEANEDSAQVAAHIAAVVANGSEVFESRHRAKDGTVWPVEVNVTYWSIAGGRLFVFVRNLARRARSEALLRSRVRLSNVAATGTLDELLRVALDEASLLTGSRLGFIHFVDEGKEHQPHHAWSSKAIQQMCGAVGKGLHYNMDQSGIWVECFHTGTPVVHNNHGSDKDRMGIPADDAVVVRELTVPIIRHGRVAAILGIGNKTIEYTPEDVEAAKALGAIVMDLVENKQAEEAVRSSEERYRVVVSAASDGIVLQGTDGKLLAWNREAERLFGISADEVLGRQHTEFEWATFREDGSAWPTAEHPSLHTLATGQEQRNIVMGVRSTGGLFSWVSVSTSPCASGVVIALSDITQRKQMEDSLRCLLAEKEVLLREIHHRVKNNLAAILGLMELQRRQSGMERLDDVLLELGRRIGSIALVHEKLYRSDQLASVDFRDYLQSLVTQLKLSFGVSTNIETRVTTNIRLSLDIAVPCGMIVSELTANSIRHAFPSGRSGAGGATPRIDISLTQEGAGYRLELADNGVGLPADVDFESTRSLGLRLVRILGEYQLGGRIEVDRSCGTRFALRFDPQTARSQSIV